MSPRLWWAAWAPMGLLTYLVINGGGYMGAAYHCLFSAPQGDYLPIPRCGNWALTVTLSVLQARQFLLSPWGFTAVIALAIVPYSTWLVVRNLQPVRRIACGIALILIAFTGLAQWSLLIPFQATAEGKTDYREPIAFCEPGIARAVFMETWRPHFSYPRSKKEIPDALR